MLRQGKSKVCQCPSEDILDIFSLVPSLLHTGPNPSLGFLRGCKIRDKIFFCPGGGRLRSLSMYTLSGMNKFVENSCEKLSQLRIDPVPVLPFIVSGQPCVL